MLAKHRIAALVDERNSGFRVDRAVYSDPELFQAEMELFFERGWLFLVHESQLKNPGDYFSTRMGRQTLELVGVSFLVYLGLGIPLAVLAATTRRPAIDLLIRAVATSAHAVPAFVLALWLQFLLFGVSSTDPVTLLGAIAVVGVAGMAATLLPARRASRVQIASMMREN